MSDTFNDTSVARRHRLIVLCPHFEPDIAPTGRVMTELVGEWTNLAHEVHVVTSLPWYRNHEVESAWRGKFVHREITAWGSITRIHPFATKSKSNLLARAMAFVMFSLMSLGCAVFAGTRGRRFSRVDAVIAMSPPLTLGIVGWLVAVLRRSRLIFNVQDIFPDAVVRTGAIRNPLVIRCASWLERFTYRHSAAVVVLSEELRSNVQGKVPARYAKRVRVIGNFIDANRVSPIDRMTPYREELGIGEEVVVMYAGNVGYSQSLSPLLEVARRLPMITVVINGSGSALDDLRRSANGITNVRFGAYQPEDRLSEVLATGDIHVVPLRKGLADVSVPSKTYSILAAGRCVVAAVDAGSEVERVVTTAGAGICVAPDDADALTIAITSLVNDGERREMCGLAGRAFIEKHLTPRDAAAAYVRLVSDSLTNS